GRSRGRAAEPLAWLRMGPGRDRPGEPGWTDAPPTEATGSGGAPLRFTLVISRGWMSLRRARAAPRSAASCDGGRVGGAQGRVEARAWKLDGCASGAELDRAAEELGMSRSGGSRARQPHA